MALARAMVPPAGTGGDAGLPEPGGHSGRLRPRDSRGGAGRAAGQGRRPAAGGGIPGRTGPTGAAAGSIEEQLQERPARYDYVFTWEQEGFRAKDATYRRTVVVQGDKIGRYSEYLYVPEKWKRDFATLRSSNELYSQAAERALPAAGAGRGGGPDPVACAGGRSAGSRSLLIAGSGGRAHGRRTSGTPCRSPSTRCPPVRPTRSLCFGRCCWAWARAWASSSM